MEARSQNKDASKLFEDREFNIVMAAALKSENPNPNIIAQQFVKAWGQTAVNCAEYALFTLNAIIFDMINQSLANKGNNAYVPSFTSVRFIKADPDTGDHSSVLVQGASGTVFLVDPTINAVIPLPYKFTKLPTLTAKHIYEFEGSDNNDLSSQFIKGGYYDALYVDRYTTWLIDIDFSRYICNLARTPNIEMNKWYDILKRTFRWEFEYQTIITENKNFKCS